MGGPVAVASSDGFAAVGRLVTRKLSEYLLTYEHIACQALSLPNERVCRRQRACSNLPSNIVCKLETTIMICVAITRTGNERDIIEAFVQHHAKIFNLIVIANDNSMDGTKQILESLQAENYPIVILEAAEMPGGQANLMSSLMHLAFDKYGADWVAPLDVDEFLEVPKDAALDQIIPQRSNYPIQLRWSNFAWSRNLDEREVNPVVRLTTRMPPRSDSSKIMVPKSIVKDDRKASLRLGNHHINSKKRVEHGIKIDGIFLCHYPIRSIQQFLAKCAINHLRLLSIPPSANRPASAGFQYRGALNCLFNEGSDSFIRYMERESTAYALQAGGGMQGQVAINPLLYRGGSLKHPSVSQNALAMIVCQAEMFAKALAFTK